MEKDIMLGKVGGRRRRGRQRMRWMEGILTETGNGLKELRELVESRHECSSGHQEPRKAERMTSSSGFYMHNAAFLLNVIVLVQD